MSCLNLCCIFFTLFFRLFHEIIVWSSIWILLNPSVMILVKAGCHYNYFFSTCIHFPIHWLDSVLYQLSYFQKQSAISDLFVTLLSSLLAVGCFQSLKHKSIFFYSSNNFKIKNKFDKSNLVILHTTVS